MTYVIIGSELYPVGTPEQCEAAAAALRGAGEREATVWASPLETIEQIEQEGDPDAYANGRKIFAWA